MIEKAISITANEREERMDSRISLLLLRIVQGGLFITGLIFRFLSRGIAGYQLWLSNIEFGVIFLIQGVIFLLWPQVALSRRLLWGISADDIKVLSWKKLNVKQKLKVAYMLFVSFFLMMVIFFATFEEMRFVLNF